MTVEEVEDGLDRGAFELWFQPIVCLRTLEIRSFEGLARFRTADGDIVGPGSFIPTVEGHPDLCRRFTDHVVELAVAFAARCRNSTTPPQIALNLAEASLGDAEFATRVRRVLEERRVPARQLVIEITERAVLGPDSAQSITIRELAQLGIGIAIDDFGTGWSSLDTLRWLPLNQLKVDRSFLEELTAGSADWIIVEKVIELARSLHLIVVAEGIERPDQLAALQAMGCQKGQGFLFSAALEPDAALDLVLRDVAYDAPINQPPATPVVGVAELELDSAQLCIDEALAEPVAQGSFALGLLDALPLSVFIKAPDGRIVWSNERHWRSMGVSSAAELLGERDLDVHRIDEALGYRFDDLTVLTTGTPILERRERQTRVDGRTLSISTSKFPVRNRSGEIIGLIGYFVEVDDHASSGESA